MEYLGTTGSTRAPAPGERRIRKRKGADFELAAERADSAGATRLSAPLLHHRRRGRESRPDARIDTRAARTRDHYQDCTGAAVTIGTKVRAPGFPRKAESPDCATSGLTPAHGDDRLGAAATSLSTDVFFTNASAAQTHDGTPRPAGGWEDKATGMDDAMTKKQTPR